MHERFSQQVVLINKEKLDTGSADLYIGAMNTDHPPATAQTPDTLWGNIFGKKNGEADDIRNVLRQVPLFANMNTGELREFEKIIHRRSFKAGETIFWEGEPGVGMYIIHRGSVTISKYFSTEERKVLAMLQAGEFFGELALLDESPRSATALAKEETKILGLFRPDLFSLLDRKPRLGSKFLFQLALIIGERLKFTNSEMQKLRAQIDRADLVV